MAVETLKTGLPVPAVCAAAGVSETAMRLLGAAADARSFLETLLLDGQYEDAVAFLAHALPRREAVWWAWSCARDSAGMPPPPAVRAALEATRSWLDTPTDAHRRAALRAAEVAGLASAAGLAGLAAFLCGASHGSGGATALPPPPFAAAKAIAGCVQLTAEGDSDIDADVPARYTDRVRRGLELADQIDLWTPPRRP